MQQAITEAWKLVNQVRPTVIGLGSGRTIIPFIEAAAACATNAISSVTFVPTSHQAKWLLDRLHLQTGDLNSFPVVDVTVDGCDAFDSQGNMIKGGGGCLLQEKLVASASHRYIILAASEKQTDRLLAHSIPVEVHPFALTSIQGQIQRTLPVISVSLRDGAPGKLGPVITDSGNFILDCTFSEDSDIHSIQTILLQIPGVIETGLFIDMHPTIIQFN